MEVDYLIIGSGLAGISFAETCLLHHKKIMVLNDNSQNSTTIAGGLYNPIVLKRFTKIWEAEAQLAITIPFYKNLETKLDTTFLYEIPLFRKLNNIEEQNNWFTASDKPTLSNYLSSELNTLNNEAVENYYKFGKVNETGFLDTKKLKEKYTNYLVAENCYLEETFDYSKLVIKDDYVEYDAIKAKKIVFAEGFGIHNNPYFNNLPLGNDLYKVGATYNWEDKSNQKTEEAKLELVTNLKELLNCNFEIIEHLAGVRPTVKDRRPLLGKHYKHNNLFILNGMGTRGVLFAPYLSDKLFQYIENKTELDNEISIERIYKKLLR